MKFFKYNEWLFSIWRSKEFGRSFLAKNIVSCFSQKNDLISIARYNLNL